MARDVSYTFDPFEIAGVDKESLSSSEKNRVLAEVADYVQTQVLKDTANGLSAVYGTRWESLSSDYKKIKRSKGGKPVANLELEGDLLSAVKTEALSDAVRIYVEADQSDKADGHNNHSGESKLPLRRFIPADGEGFRSGIERKIKEIVREAEPVSLADQAIQELIGGLQVSTRPSR